MIVFAVVYVTVWLASAAYLARRNEIHKDVDSDLDIGLTSLAAAALWPLALALRAMALFGRFTRRAQGEAPPDPLLAALDELASGWEHAARTYEAPIKGNVYEWFAARLRETMADNAP